MLCAENITLTLSGRLVLSDVSANCAPGKVTVILGPNGAGKSSLLACLSGGRGADSGAVTIGDAPLSALSGKDRARRIGLLPQSGDVHWDIEARALVALGRFARQGRGGLSATDTATIDAAMQATDTAQFAARNVLRLSGGERARVLLARVLAGEPEWLLTDEPLANLDPGHQIDMLDVLSAQAKRGTGVIAVLHDLGQAARIADHIILMREGAVFESGIPSEVLTREALSAVYGVACALETSADGVMRVEVTGRVSPTRM
jgi:iron complex transport system ATP-binding protein